MIRILNSSFEELAAITVASSCIRTEKINSDNILNFSIRIKDSASAYINENNIIDLDGDYFDIAFYKKEQQSDGKLMVSVECEHISYRLNEEIVDFFTETGTPTEILNAILNGTCFTVGTVDFSETETFSLQQSASKRALLMQFAAYVGGELQFDGFEISLLTQRGSSTPKALTVGKDITVISKAVNKRVLDAEGNPQISYACGVYKGAALALGDVVTLNYSALDISASLRVVSKSYDPYNPNNVTVEIGNFINALEDDIYRIQTTTVVKDKIYHGCRIGPENGFECIRNDKKARAYLNSTNLALQAGDGTGSSWTNKLYYDLDPETGLAELFFAGKFTVEAIEAIKANIDIIVSNTFVTNTLYSEYGRIANLSVSELNTSWKKITNYLASSTAPVLYKRDYEQYSLYIVAITDGSQTEQVKDSNENNLYWTDETHTGMTTTVTDYPVLTYVYTELTKGVLSFYLDGSDYIFDIELGAGVGNPLYPDRGKAHIRKKTDGLSILYTTPDGEETEIKLDNFVDAKMRRVEEVTIDKTAGTLTVLMEGDDIPEVINFTETADSITYSWADGFTTTVKIS